MTASPKKTFQSEGRLWMSSGTVKGGISLNFIDARLRPTVRNWLETKINMKLQGHGDVFKVHFVV